MLKRLLVLLFCIIVSACAANKPYVSISAISSGANVGKRYIIVPANQQIWNNDQLTYIQLAKQAVLSLSMKGYTLVPNKELADQMIMLDYRRSGAVTNSRIVSVPEWGQTGVSSSTTYGNVNTNLNSYGNYGTANSTYNATTVYNPTYGITGYHSEQVTDTAYSIGVSLTSVSLRDLEINKVTNLWKVQAISTSHKQDGLADFQGLIRLSSEYANTTLGDDIHTYTDPRLAP